MAWFRVISSSRYHRALIEWLPALVLVGPLLILGVGTTRDLSWAEDDDLFRVISEAQTFAQGSLSDPYYRGEGIWYNPLVSLVVAGIAHGYGLPVNVVEVRLGAYLNLLGPLAFYALAWRTFGATAATAATCGFVFYRDLWAASWITAAYSPWLFPMTFAQGLFYLSLLAYRWSVESGRAVAFAACGAVSGLTLMCHTAPALVLGGVVLLVGVAEIVWPRADGLQRPRPALWPSVGRHALLLVVLVIVASPYLQSIVWRYRLHVLNQGPPMWEWAQFRDLAGFLVAQATPPAFVAALGLLVLCWRARRSIDARLAVAWMLAACLPLAYRLAANRFGWQRLLPSHHFVFYAKAAQWLLVGVVVSWALAGARRLLARLPQPWSRPIAADGLGLAAVVVAALPWALPQYATRGYFGAAREGALRVEVNEAEQAAYRWIREHTEQDAVFLGPPELILRVVGPTGRKAVVASLNQSNPYVDWQTRSRSATRMLRALIDGDERTFLALARQYDVGYIVATGETYAWLGPLVRSRRVASVARCFNGVRSAGRGAVRVYGVRRPGETTPCPESDP
jgi:hypothetical protein